MCIAAVLSVASTTTMVGEDIQSQTAQVMENLRAILLASGSDMSKVLRATCYLSDIDLYDGFNDVYLRYFPDEATRPARVCFAVAALPFSAKIEVEVTAFVS